MSSTYYPLIGIDQNHNEHSREWPGVNAKDAARLMAERYGYIEVLSGVADQKRGSSRIHHRMSLFKAPQAAFRKGAATTALADQLSSKLGRESIKPLIAASRSQGVVFTLIDRDGKVPKLQISASPFANISSAALEDLREFARERPDIFIRALQQETPKDQLQQKDQDDPLKGKKIQDIVLAMLPQMPSTFDIDQFAERVKAAGYTVLSNDRTRLQNAIFYAIDKKGQVERVGRGRYKVVEEFRHPRANGDARPPIEPEPVIIDIQPPPPVPPPPPLELSYTPAAPITVPPPVDPILSPDAFSPHALVATILDLASQAAVGPDDPLILAEQLNRACAAFENSVLDAVASLTASVKPIVEQLTKTSATRRALIQSFTTQAQPEPPKPDGAQS